MKKILAVFLLLASICSAQIEHSGLTIPGDGAVQVGRKSGAGFPFSGLTHAYFSEDFAVNAGSAAVWPDRSGNGNNATCSVEANKPSASGAYLLFETDDVLVAPPTTSGAQTATILMVGAVPVTVRWSFWAGWDDYASTIFISSQMKYISYPALAASGADPGTDPAAGVEVNVAFAGYNSGGVKYGTDYVNGATGATVAHGAGNPDASPFKLGTQSVNGWTGSYSGNFKVKRIFVWNRVLTKKELDLAVQYAETVL